MADEEIEIRRAPKVLPWMLTGAAVGMVAALILSLVTPPNPELPENFLGLMLIAFGSLGLGLGVLFAIAFDLISARRAKRAIANRVTE
jgi:hypothetical protein